MSGRKTTREAGQHKRDNGPPAGGDSQRASGGELHQAAGGTHAAISNSQATAIADLANSLRANPRGPMLLRDLVPREKTVQFDQERLPERIAHARGAGVPGFIELTPSPRQNATARVFPVAGAKTTAFVCPRDSSWISAFLLD